MAGKRPPLSIDVVSSIFKRAKTKRVSALFKGPTKQTKAKLGIEKEALKPTVRKRFHLGVDIGASSIKFAQLGRVNGNLQIINLAVEELLPGAIGNLKEAGHLLPDILKKHFKMERMKLKVVSSISSAKAQIQLIRLPKMPLSEVEQALMWEVRQKGSINLNESSLDYIVLDEERIDEASSIEVLSVTTLKKDVFELTDLLEAAGLAPFAVEVDPLSIISGLTYSRQLEPEKVIILLEFGAGLTSLNVTVNNQLRFSRNLKVDGNTLTRAVQDYSGVSFQEAEELKRISGITDKEARVRNALLPILDNLVSDIEHSFKYFSYQLMQSRIVKFDKVILSGGSSALPGLQSFLASRLNVPVEIANSIGTMAIGDDVAQRMGDLKPLLPRLTVAMGLALRDVE